MRKIGLAPDGKGGLQLTEFPSAAKVIALEGAKAEQLAHWGSHDADLGHAQCYLDALQKAEEQIVKEALFHSAIVRFCRCFAQGVRARLREDEVYEDQVHGAFEAFQYFDDLRNKYIAHDVSPYAQCVPHAIVNKSEASRKIESVGCMSMLSYTVNDGDIDNLARLIKVAREWIHRRFDSLADEMQAELEVLSHEELLKRNALQINVPTPAQVSSAKRQRRS